ncbi:hypothetical protein J1N35_045570 [Gossypium stocksii]|uniref:MATH domain-containing protein n=1 Tax=Gossypium stocksii TaxID=47602 RepID=A0A9D3ZH43_9ROSI|nr:hypothetical protein J1N35_045570 [Gossypium stocksii]
MEFNAQFSFLVSDQFRDKYLTIQDGTIRRYHESKAEWGVPRLLSLDVFNDVSMGYLVEDCCISGSEVLVIKDSGRTECLSMVKKQLNNIYIWKIEKFSVLD